MAKRHHDPLLKERVKNLFSMHASERRGVLMMMAFLLVLATWVCYEQWFRDPPDRDLAHLEAGLENWLAEREANKPDSLSSRLFPFDPNTVGRDEWRALGLTDRQIDGVERYLDKGGKFRTKKDLGRMYSLKPEQFDALEPFILLPDSLPRRTFADRTTRTYQDASKGEGTIRERTIYTPYVREKVEVNTADTVALIALPGIGPAFARGIVKYRDLLGGFHSLDQLAEVYVLKDKPDAVLSLKELLILDTSMVHQIPINTCTVEELAAHPYLRWKLAKPLIAYRAHHGPFKRVEDIRGCTLIDEELFRKLAPYLSVE